jgi:glycosyltransferase involved in cell wall biosynthesis
VSKRADLLIAISKHTKNDYVAYAGVSRDKVKVIHLGIDRSLPSLKNVEFQEYYETGWGYSRKSIDLTTKPFLLFLGGADPRRKLIHLVAAYNNLKAQGHDIRLVMVGDIMKGPSSIPIIDVQNYLSESSYLDDISFLGFVSDPQREWLYSHAKAMVYPSVYEGFGLPILEAMQHGTPVITYDNSSIREVAGSAAIYAYGANDIKDCVEKLLLDKRMWEKYGKLGREQASKFDWQKTAKSIVNELIS